MENNIKVGNPLLISFSIKSGKVISDYTIEEIRLNVLEGKIVILKNVFSEEQMIIAKNKIIAWGNENPLFPHGESPGKYPSLNYHRIDDGTIPSVCPHIFHQYGFNSIGDLPKEYADILSEVANELTIIQNLVAETSFNISLTGLRLKVLQYPEGGAFLQKHSHPKEPQKIGLILSLSKHGKDFKKGAASFETPDGFVDTVNDHDIGDVIIFRYDLPHEVTPVNPERIPIDWSLPTGKWSVVLELRDTHGLSHK